VSVAFCSSVSVAFVGSETDDPDASVSTGIANDDDDSFLDFTSVAGSAAGAAGVADSAAGAAGVVATCGSTVSVATCGFGTSSGFFIYDSVIEVNGVLSSLSSINKTSSSFYPPRYAHRQPRNQERFITLIINDSNK
jgi:hypothetical protein